jgi:hypothetical protein
MGSGIEIHILLCVCLCVCVCDEREGGGWEVIRKGGKYDQIAFDVWLTVHRNSVWIKKTN